MVCHLVALEKAHRVCRVDIRDIIRHFSSKWVLLVTGAKATEACSNITPVTD